MSRIIAHGYDAFNKDVKCMDAKAIKMLTNNFKNYILRHAQNLGMVDETYPYDDAFLLLHHFDDDHEFIKGLRDFNDLVGEMPRCDLRRLMYEIIREDICVLEDIEYYIQMRAEEYEMMRKMIPWYDREHS